MEIIGIIILVVAAFLLIKNREKIHDMDEYDE
jgi:hypothetical protein